LTAGGLFAGLDLGTSSLKGVVVDSAGRLMASAQASYPTHRPSPDRAEQSPADWIAAAQQVMESMSQKSSVADWVALGLSGMIPTLVTLDDARNPVGPAITWEDARAEEEGIALRDAIGPERLYRLTGQWVDGRYLLPMFAWLRRHEPERVSSTAMMCSAKDYLYLYLTGQLATDPSTAAGYGCYELESGSWNGDVAQAAGVRLPALPEILTSTARSPLRAALARELGVPERLPVCVGAADSALGALGLGVAAPGQVAYIAGTSTVILGVSDRVELDFAHRYLVTPLATAGTWGLEMDLLSTGSAVQWLAGIMGLAGGASAVLELAEGSIPGSNGLTFLPYLSSGEQGALWDAALRGAIFGLTLGHRREDLARALLEAIAIESGRCIRVLKEAGFRSNQIMVSGAGGGSALVWQLLADATECSVTIPPPSVTMVSAFGAALMAAVAIGADPSPMRAGPGGEQFHPAAQSASLWTGLSRRHDEHLAMISAKH
jgi:sugar (pentulose or hexulose) kinase